MKVFFQRIKNHKTGRFILLLSIALLIYLILHLQFLIGLPQAALSLWDVGMVISFAVIFYVLGSGKKWYYYTGLGLAFFPFIELQYIFMKILGKPFLLRDLWNIPDLIIVSPLFLKVFYTCFGFAYFSAVFYILYLGLGQWKRLKFTEKLIPLPFLLYLIITLGANKSKIEVEWTTGTAMHYYGIVNNIQRTKPPSIKSYDKEDVRKSFYKLLSYEQERWYYPVQDSPTEAPLTRRPIVVVIWESFYDARHFIPLFDKDPFPKEYRALMGDRHYTGINRFSGSFPGRFTTLTASSLAPTRSFAPTETLGHILSNHFYKSLVLESVSPTYNMDAFYPHWGFKDIKWKLFDVNWGSEKFESYENNFSKAIEKGGYDFYFGFTFLGHAGLLNFTRNFPYPEGIESYLSYFPNKESALKSIKSEIFNAQRFMRFIDIILKKYPDALIVFKTDHLSADRKLDIEGSNLPQQYKDAFFNEATPLPFLVLDGTNGALSFEKGFSSTAVPLMILAEAGIPYKETMISLLAPSMPQHIVVMDDGLFYREKGTLRPLRPEDPNYQEALNRKKDYDTISADLYQGKGYVFEFLQEYRSQKSN